MKSYLHRVIKIALIIIPTFIAISIHGQFCNNTISNLGVRSTSAISLYKTWNIYLYKSNFYKVPSLYTLVGTDTVPINNACASWTTTDTTIATVKNGIATAKNTGSTTLTASINGYAVSIPLQVNAEIKPVEYTADIDAFLTTPADKFKSLTPVVVICFIPTNDGININTVEAAFSPIPAQTIDELKKHILKISRHTKFSLEEGSRFRGFKDPSAIPYLGYKIVDYIYVYEPVPRGYKDPGSAAFFGDYDVIINRFNGKKYVDTLGVKEFWIMGYHNGDIVPVESNMSSPTTPDISNSYRYPDDLPIYSKTYILYNYNFTREGNEATHNHGHQIESMVDYVAARQDGNTNLFSSKFRGYGRVGDTHHPPNATADYDYYNPAFVASDILDWKPEGGTQTLVNSNTWGNINYNWPAGATPNVESHWYVLWMQSLPGYNNHIPYNSTKEMTNWWEFLSNWDSTAAKIGLYKNTVLLPVNLTSIKAYEKSAGTQLEWEVQTESNIERYEVERAVKGSAFIKTGTVLAKNNENISTTYYWIDVEAMSGNNFYRIKSVGRSGEIKYSAVVSVNRSKQGNEITVYPNPVKGNMLGVYFNVSKGQYVVTLTNKAGQQVYKQTINHQGGSAMNSLQLPARLANGSYQLEVVGGERRFVTQVIKKE